MNRMAQSCRFKLGLSRFQFRSTASPVIISSEFLRRENVRSIHILSPLFIRRQSILTSQNCSGLRIRSRRRFLSSSKPSKTEPKDDSSSEINKRGGIWIYLGWSILGLVAVDQALQYKHELEDDEKRRILAEMQISADNASFNVADWDENLPTLFACKILHVDPGLDGTKMLTRRHKTPGGRGLGGINGDIQRGHVVEILQAGVGPSQRYHLCRWQPNTNKNKSNSSLAVVGWYPIDFLERID